jgi:hypothetical protein
MIRLGLIALLSFYSCAKKTAVPKNILPPDKMEKVLMDLMEADELIIRKSADSVFNDSLDKGVIYNTIFRQHKTNKEEFKKSFSYYESHPELLKVVLDSIQSKARETIKESKTLIKNKRPV